LPGQLRSGDGHGDVGARVEREHAERPRGPGLPRRRLVLRGALRGGSGLLFGGRGALLRGGGLRLDDGSRRLRRLAAAPRSARRILGEEEEQEADDQRHREEGPGGERDPHLAAAPLLLLLAALVLPRAGVDRALPRFLELDQRLLLRGEGLL